MSRCDKEIGELKRKYRLSDSEAEFLDRNDDQCGPWNAERIAKENENENRGIKSFGDYEKQAGENFKKE